MTEIQKENLGSIEREICVTGGQEDQLLGSVAGSAGSVDVSSSSSQPRSQRSQMSVNEMRSSNNSVTFVKATLGREATIQCIAENLVGQKTVRIQFFIFSLLGILRVAHRNRIKL